MGGAGRSEESPLHPAIAIAIVIAIAIAVALNRVIRNLLIHAII
jgi:hypothetical protein